MRRVAAMIMAAAAAAARAADGHGLQVYVGTYSQRGSEGIYATRLDPATGRLDP